MPLSNFLPGNLDLQAQQDYTLPYTAAYKSLYTGLELFDSNLFENDLRAAIPQGFLVLAALLLLMYGVFYAARREENYPLLLKSVTVLAQHSFVCTLLLLYNSPFTEACIFYNSYAQNSLTLFLQMLLCVAVFLSVCIAMQYTLQEGFNSFEYIILIMLSTVSMLFLVCSADLISMYLAIELQSLCFYVMAALKRNSEFSTEAALKYFLLGAFSSGILLFGCSLVYGYTGITNFSELAQIFACDTESLPYGLSSLRGCELGMVFILVALLFKNTAAPFHMYAPDVYEGAPTSVTAFLSIVPKISVLALFVNFSFQAFYDLILPWQQILLFSSIASMLVGALAALSQKRIKRLLAFSSIGHVGYLLVAFCCGTVEGIQALLIYLVVYIAMTTNIFAIVLCPLRRQGNQVAHSTESKVKRVKYTTDFAMLSRNNPILAITLTVTLFSMAGIPPLAGFYSKAFLMFAAVSASQHMLAFVAVLTSVVSCFYYIRIVKTMYFESPADWCTFAQIPKETSIVLGITLCFLLFLFLYPAPLFLATHKLALSVCY